MVRPTTELKAKFSDIMPTAVADSISAGQTKVITVWYSAYLDDFLLVAGYANNILGSKNNIVVMPKDEKAVKLHSAICHYGQAIHEPSAEFFRKCADFYAAFDEKASEEYQFMALSLKAMAETFPIKFGDTLDKPQVLAEGCRHSSQTQG